MKPVGVRFDAATLERLQALAPQHGTFGDVVRDLVTQALDAPAAGALPELFGTKQAAEALGVATGNLGKVAGLPEPLYSPDHDDPRRRVAGGKLYDAEAIRALARTRPDRRARNV